MAGVKTELTDFLNQLWLGIDGKLKMGPVEFPINTEADLEKFVQIPLNDSRTLLRILGYGKDEVDGQPTDVTVVGRSRYRPDYVLHRQQKPVVILDLKSPRENLADPKWVEQIDSYCRIKKVPLGLLFNGVDALLFVNLSQVTQVNRAELKEYAEWLPVLPVNDAEQLTVLPIMFAQRHEPKEMVELLNFVSTWVLTSRDEAVRKASVLVRQRLKELKERKEGEKRQREIRERIKAIQGDHVALGKMLSAACASDKILRAMKPKPSASELLEAWLGLPPLTEGPKTGGNPKPSGANIQLKAKLAEVCAVKGWNESWAIQIKRFRYRLNGVEDKGFRRIKQTSGVPPGLCIPGYSTRTAEFIIEQLDQLLKKEE